MKNIDSVGLIKELMYRINCPFLSESIEEVYRQEVDDNGEITYKNLDGQTLFDDPNFTGENRGEEQFNKMSTSVDVLIEIGRYAKSIDDLNKANVAEIFNGHLKDRDIEIISKEDAERMYADKKDKIQNWDELINIVDLMYKIASGKSSGKLGSIIELFYGKPGDNKSNPDFGSGAGQFGDAVEAKSIFSNGANSVINFSGINLGRSVGGEEYDIDGSLLRRISTDEGGASQECLAYMLTFPARLDVENASAEKFSDIRSVYVRDDNKKKTSVTASLRSQGGKTPIIRLKDMYHNKMFIEYVSVNYTESAITIDVFGNFVDSNPAIPPQGEDYRIAKIIVPFEVIGKRLVHKMSRTFTAHGKIQTYKNGRPHPTNSKKTPNNQVEEPEQLTYYMHIDYATIGAIKQEFYKKIAVLTKMLLSKGFLKSHFDFVFPQQLERGQQNYSGIYFAFAMNFKDFSVLFDEKIIDDNVIRELRYEKGNDDYSDAVDDKMGGVYEHKNKKRATF